MFSHVFPQMTNVLNLAGAPFYCSMPAKSKKQQMAAGAALAAKRGKKSKGSLKGPSKSMAKMSEKELRKIAGTKRKSLPKKKTTKSRSKK